MLEADDQRDPLEVLAAEFVERKRRGELPSISEYAARRPDLAADIEELFPAIAVMEQVKAHKEQGSGVHASLGGIRLERLGDFRILGEIGRGGMGIVYEAFQESLGRHVAVKVLPGQTLLDPLHLRRFQREAQTAARLHHTNIVPVFGVGEHGGFHYIVMQLIDGAGLDDVLVRLRQAHDPIAPVAGKEPPRIAGLGAAPPSRSRDGTEVARLARALAQGQFGQSHEFDSVSPDGSDDPGQTGSPPGLWCGRPACPPDPANFRAAGTAAPQSPPDLAESGKTQEELATAGQPPSPAAATEEFAFQHDTKVNGNCAATDLDTAASPKPIGSWKFGPPYWRSVARIGQQLADALHYAHSHQTLHRDIKPANVLLDSQGVAWITDFGLAKAMEQDNVTQTGAMVGTLRYMAPEQFSGHADARNDIYSLGLTLYELLTLRPAFEANSRSSLIAKIAHGEPPGPRRLNPAIPRDLETIVLKAMAREPRDRYATAGELARDLACFLEDRPIQARRTPAAERLWRWARRNRAVASLLACSLALLVAVAVVASVGYVRIAQANAREKIERSKAEEISNMAVSALDNIFRQFAPDRTAPASASLRVSDAEDPIAVPVQPVFSKEAAALLEHMLKFYDLLAAQGGDDAALRRKVAQANGRVGDIRQRLGQYAESKAAYMRAIDLYTGLVESSATGTGRRAEIARIHNELGNVYDAMNETEAGRASHMDALAALQAASAESAASPDCQYELARTYYFLGKRSGGPPGPPPPGLNGPHGPRGGPPGFVFDLHGPHHGPRAPFPLMPAQKGEERLDKALALWQSLVDDDSPWPSDGPRTPHDHQHGQPHGQPDSPPNFADGNRQESENYRQAAVELLERLVAGHPEVPAYRHLLARCYREAPPRWADRGAKSVPDSLSKASQILEELVKENPDVADYRYDLSETYAMLGDPGSPEQNSPGRGMGQRSPAMLEKALTLAELLVAEHPNVPDYAVSSVNTRLRLSNSLWESDPTRAEANLSAALKMQSTLVHRFPDNYSYKFWLAVIQESLGRLYMKHDRLPEARTALQDCIDTFRAVLEKDAKAGFVRFILAGNYMNLAEVLRGMGEDKAAEEATRQAQNLGQQR